MIRRISMEYIIIGILIVILTLLLVLMLKKPNETNITERLGKLEVEVIKEISNFKSDFSKDLREDF